MADNKAEWGDTPPPDENKPPNEPTDDERFEEENDKNTKEKKKNTRRTKQDQIDSLTAEKQELEDKYNQAVAQVNKMKSEKDLLELMDMTDKQDLDEKYNLAVAQIKKLKSDKDILEKDAQQNKSDKQDLDDKHNLAVAQIKKLKGEKQKLEQDAQQVKTDKQDLEDKYNLAVAQINKLKGEKSALEQKVQQDSSGKQNLDDNYNLAMTQIKNLKDEKATLEQQVQQERGEKQRLQNEVVKTSSLLDEERNAKQSLLNQMQDSSSDDEDMPQKNLKYLFICDIPGKNLLPHFKGSSDTWTSMEACSISDLMKTLDDPNIISELRKYDKIIVKIGTVEIVNGEKGGKIANRLLKVLEILFKKTEVEIAVVHAHPTNQNEGIYLTMNSRLSKTLELLPYIQQIPLEKTMEEIIKSEILCDDKITLNDKGIDTVTGIVLKEVTPPNPDKWQKFLPDKTDKDPGKSDRKADLTVQTENRDGGNNRNDRKRKFDDNNNNNDEDIEETIFIPKIKVGRVIGKGGASVRAIRSTAKCGIRVVQIKKRDMASIKGNPENVLKAESIIRKLLDDSFFSQQRGKTDDEIITAAAEW